MIVSREPESSEASARLHNSATDHSHQRLRHTSFWAKASECGSLRSPPNQSSFVSRDPESSEGSAHCLLLTP